MSKLKRGWSITNRGALLSWRFHDKHLKISLLNLKIYCSSIQHVELTLLREGLVHRDLWQCAIVTWIYFHRRERHLCKYAFTTQSYSFSKFDFSLTLLLFPPHFWKPDPFWVGPWSFPSVETFIKPHCDLSNRGCFHLYYMGKHWWNLTA